jgi:DNA-binding phage protein
MEGINKTEQVRPVETQESLNSPQKMAEEFLYATFQENMSPEKVAEIIAARGTVERSSERI